MGIILRMMLLISNRSTMAGEREGGRRGAAGRVCNQVLGPAKWGGPCSTERVGCPTSSPPPGIAAGKSGRNRVSYQ